MVFLRKVLITGFIFRFENDMVINFVSYIEEIIAFKYVSKLIDFSSLLLRLVLNWHVVRSVSIILRTEVL